MVSGCSDISLRAQDSLQDHLKPIPLELLPRFVNDFKDDQFRFSSLKSFEVAKKVLKKTGNTIFISFQDPVPSFNPEEPLESLSLVKGEVYASLASLFNKIPGLLD